MDGVCICVSLSHNYASALDIENNVKYIVYISV